jgi:outer membrane receptor protein involved in Fe transport
MNNRLRFLSQISFALILMLAALPAFAQETTASVQVTVVDVNGSPVPGATVVVTDTRTGIARSSSTNDSGFTLQRGLAVGGPYVTNVTADGYGAKQVTEITLQLGDTHSLVVELESGSNLEEVVVTSAAIGGESIALGPASVFGLKDLETMPAINRDLRDIIQQDPRIYIDVGFVGGIQCAGANPRFNSLTVDGVRMNDNFGLNSTGYPTERTPFPYDALQQVSVELAPFDVEYGGFTACNINAVTKSGANEFHGSMFYDYTNDDMKGDSLEGQSIATGDFDEQRYGFSLGGPILKDRLFFFLAYEKLKGSQLFERGPANTNAILPVNGVSQAQYDEILQIAQDVYGYDPGGLPTSIPVDDEKIFGRIDWNINDFHRASIIYNWNDGFSIAQADSGSQNLEFSNHYYERGAELTQYSAQLFSDWTSNFSTEARVAYSELDNRQIPLGPIDFGEVQISTLNDHDGNGINSTATVFLGADDSRHANKLYYETWQFKLAGTYTLGDHAITGGVEQESYDVFNMFIQEAEGEYRFSSIANFRNGIASQIIYENAAPTNVKEDAGANFGYEVNTAYLQDNFSALGGDLNIVLGLRYDWYTSNDEPRYNARFEERYGYSNTSNMDGKDLLQPRLGFDWSATDSLTVHGGVGLYSGGNPNVWIANNYQNDGQTQVEIQDRTGTPLSTMVWTGSGRPIWDIPQHLYNAVANGTADSGVNAMDPNFDVPSNWKYNLGFNWYLGDDGSWTVNGDIVYSTSDNSAILIDGTLQQIGTAPDGRPIYRGIDRRDPDCVTPTAAACSARSQDFILTNVKGSDARQMQIAVGVGKAHFDQGIDWYLGYAYTESEDVNPMTSSVAFSNLQNMATRDLNNPGLANSNYENPHRFTGRLSWEKAFFGDSMTRASLFASYNEGRPYTYTFSNDAMFGDTMGAGHQLLYVPTGPTDPNVVFAPSFNQAGFFDFVNSSGLSRYSGRIVDRNAFYGDWWFKMDLKLEQEFPGFRSGHKFAAFFIVENLTNLINDNWGVFYEPTFPQYQRVVNATINADGKYVYSSYTEPQAQARVGAPSLWEARIGLTYSF